MLSTSIVPELVMVPPSLSMPVLEAPVAMLMVPRLLMVPVEEPLGLRMPMLPPVLSTLMVPELVMVP